MSTSYGLPWVKSVPVRWRRRGRRPFDIRARSPSKAAPTVRAGRKHKHAGVPFQSWSARPALAIIAIAATRGRIREPCMSAIAEPFQHTKPDDNLARRNALVLAVAQALAGGNNTVIVSTASIVGAVLAPDKGL